MFYDADQIEVASKCHRLTEIHQASRLSTVLAAARSATYADKRSLTSASIKSVLPSGKKNSVLSAVKINHFNSLLFFYLRPCLRSVLKYSD
jgi:hypothetical protein